MCERFYKKFSEFCKMNDNVQNNRSERVSQQISQV